MSNVSDATKQLTSTLSGACTSACTSEAENMHADTQQGQDEAVDQSDPLAKLADALLTLSPADRERLAAILKGDNA